MFPRAANLKHNSKKPSHSSNLKYIDRIGYNIGVNSSGQFLRTPSNTMDGYAVYIKNDMAQIRTELEKTDKEDAYKR